MAETYKVRYKNHCTPQEQVLTDGRWYLDSDCGRKLTGNVDTSAILSATGTLTTGVSVTTDSLTLVSSVDFIYVKNTGSKGDADVRMSLTSSTANVILLSPGEAFASEISTSAVIKVQTYSGTTTIEHFSET